MSNTKTTPLSKHNSYQNHTQNPYATPSGLSAITASSNANRS
jgi:hypothetical protein